jgi:hypothetical protein
MPTKTASKKAAPIKTIAKRAAPPPTPSTNGDSDEPLIRVAFSAEDLTKLVDHIDGWDDSLVYRLKMRLAKHNERWG